MTTANLITIGDEILIGRTVDTNSAWLGDQLARAGVPVRRIVSIADVESEIRAALDSAFEQSDIVIMTGGLGATIDDITRKTLANYFNSHLTVHQPTLDRIRAFFEMRGRALSDANASVASVPDCCEALPNMVGIAPGMRFDLPNGKVLFSTPGVPFEMKYLTETYIIPFIKEKYTENKVRTAVLRMSGITEGDLAARLTEVENRLPEEIKLAYNPSFTSMDLRLVLVCPTEKFDELNALYDDLLDEIRRVTADVFYGVDDETLQGKLGELLLADNLTVATAESCTGGSLCGRLLSVAGASAYVQGGVVAYANEAKTALLGVKTETLAEFGAVSEQTAIEMAIGARLRLKTDFALATTGVAGPGGGSPEKPVGTVWVGFADENGAFAKKFRFDNNRERNIERTVVAAMNILRLQLMKRNN